MAYNDANPGAMPVEAGVAAAGLAAGWWRPPAPPEEQRRRFGWGRVMVAAVVVLALVAGGLGVRASLHHASMSAGRAAVRRAYLGWWGARAQAYLELDPAPLKALMTPSGYAQEAAQVAQQAATGDPFRLVAVHNLQVAVYAGSPYASVDDVWADHSVALDPTTRQPVQPDPDIMIEDSATLKFVGGHWLVGEVYRFGISSATSGEALSYAALDGGKPPPQRIQSQVETSFDRFISAAATALRSSNSAGVSNLATGAEMAEITSAIARDKGQGKGLHSKSETNIRIALQDNQTGWVYDSYYESYVYVNAKTGARISRPKTAIGHVAYRLVKEPNGWKVDYSLGS